MKLINKKFNIVYPTSLENLAKEFANSEIYEKILNFFGLKEFPKVNVFLYDDKNKFLKECKGTLPEFATGYQFNGNIYYCFENSLEFPKQMLNKWIYHEFVHTVYNSLNYTKSTWVNEGLAKLLANEYFEFEKAEENKNFLLNAFNKTFKLKYDEFDMNTLNYKNLITKNYNGYILSSICILYLLQANTITDFFKILEDESQITNISKNILFLAVEKLKTDTE